MEDRMERHFMSRENRDKAYKMLDKTTKRRTYKRSQSFVVLDRAYIEDAPEYGRHAGLGSLQMQGYSGPLYTLGMED